ncbi:hypothetical protein CcaverHIS002_0209140 [Cutaneotrichosporon cavernicola]|nr:hypothetical protein CcaverHIS002_0209140 [Cutaneotrichosporon cavernicola]
MLEYIYICRHGFRLSDGSNWTSQHHHAPTGMDRDYPLAALGLNQAEDLGRFLSDPERTAPYPPPRTRLLLPLLPVCANRLTDRTGPYSAT